MSDLYVPGGSRLTRAFGTMSDATLSQQIAVNTNLLLEVNPWLSQNQEALIQLATSGADPEILMDGTAALAGIQSMDKMASLLQNLSPIAQRSVYGRLTEQQQRALNQMGYQPDAGDLFDGNWFSDAVGGVADALAPVAGFAMRPVGSIAGPVLGTAFDVLTWVGDVPGHLYRVIRQQDSWEQWIALGAGIAGGIAAGALALPTGGASVAAYGTLMSAGIIGGGALGAAAASTALTSVTNPDEWWDTFTNKNGERIFEADAVTRAQRTIGGAQHIYAIVRDFALDMDPYELATQFAGVREGEDPQVFARSIQRIASKMADPGTPEYDTVLRGLTELSNQPEFRQAVDELAAGKISMGRDFANLIGLDPGDQFYGLVSGAVDGFTLFALDPTMAAGGLLKVARLARRGLTNLPSGPEAIARFADMVATDPAVGRVVDEVAFAIDQEMPHLLPRAWRSMAQPLFEWKRTLAAQGRTGPFTRDEMLMYFEHGGGLKRLMEGKATIRGIEHVVISTQNSKAGWGRFVSEVRKFRDGMDDVAMERQLKAVATKHGVADDLERTLPSNLEDTPVEMRWTRDVDMPTDAAYQAGRAVARYLPGGATLGVFTGNLTNMIPAGKAIRLVGEGSEDDIFRFVQTFGRHFNLPSWIRNEWLDTIIRQGNIGQRRQALASFMDSVLVAGGMRSTDELSLLADEFVMHHKQAFGLGGLDVTDIDGVRRIVGVLPEAHQAVMMVMPNLREMSKVIRRGHILKHVARVTDSNFVEASMSRFWKPAVLLRIGFIPRAAGEEALAWWMRAGEGSIGQEFGARSIAQGEAYRAAQVMLAERGPAALTELERAALGFRHVTHVRPLVAAGRRLGWEAAEDGLLGRYSDWLRNALEFGIGSDLAMRVPAWAQGLVLGRPHSWRRMLLNGVDPDLTEAALSWTFRHSDAIMRATSSLNASLIERQIVNPDVLTLHVRDDTTSAGRREALVVLSGERGRVSQADPRFASALHHRIGEPFMDEILGPILANHLLRYMPPNMPTLDQSRVWQAVALSGQMRTWSAKMLVGALLQPREDNLRATVEVIRNVRPTVAQALDGALLTGDMSLDNIIGALMDGKLALANEMGMLDELAEAGDAVAMARRDALAGEAQELANLVDQLNIVRPVVEAMPMLDNNEAAYISALLTANMASDGHYLSPVEADQLTPFGGPEPAQTVTIGRMDHEPGLKLYRGVKDDSTWYVDPATGDLVLLAQKHSEWQGWNISFSRFDEQSLSYAMHRYGFTGKAEDDRGIMLEIDGDWLLSQHGKTMEDLERNALTYSNANPKAERGPHLIGGTQEDANEVAYFMGRHGASLTEIQTRYQAGVFLRSVVKPLRDALRNGMDPNSPEFQRMLTTAWEDVTRYIDTQWLSKIDPDMPDYDLELMNTFSLLSTHFDDWVMSLGGREMRAGNSVDEFLTQNDELVAQLWGTSNDARESALDQVNSDLRRAVQHFADQSIRWDDLSHMAYWDVFDPYATGPFRPERGAVALEELRETLRQVLGDLEWTQSDPAFLQELRATLSPILDGSNDEAFRALGVIDGRNGPEMLVYPDPDSSSEVPIYEAMQDLSIARIPDTRTELRIPAGHWRTQTTEDMHRILDRARARAAGDDLGDNMPDRFAHRLAGADVQGVSGSARYNEIATDLNTLLTDDNEELLDKAWLRLLLNTYKGNWPGGDIMEPEVRNAVVRQLRAHHLEDLSQSALRAIFNHDEVVNALRNVGNFSQHIIFTDVSDAIWTSLNRGRGGYWGPGREVEIPAWSRWHDSYESFERGVLEDLAAALMRPENQEWTRQSELVQTLSDGRRVANPLAEGLNRIYTPNVGGNSKRVSDYLAEARARGDLPNDQDVVNYVVERLLEHPSSMIAHPDLVRNLSEGERRQLLAEAVWAYQRNPSYNAFSMHSPLLGVGYDDPRIAQWVAAVISGDVDQTPALTSLSYVDVARNALESTGEVRNGVRFMGNTSAGRVWSLDEVLDPQYQRLAADHFTPMADGSIVPGATFTEAIRDYAQRAVNVALNDIGRGVKETLVVRASPSGKNRIARKMGSTLQEVPAGTRLNAPEDLFWVDDAGEANPITWGDPRFFDAESTRSTDILWPVVGPLIRDHFEISNGLGRVVPRTLKKPRVGEISDAEDYVSMTHGRVDDLDKLPEDSLPSVALSEQYRMLPNNVWDRIVRFGFDKVIGPTIDALVRKPMSFHYYAAAYKQHKQYLSWMLDRDLFDTQVAEQFNAVLDALSNARLPLREQLDDARLVAREAFDVDLANATEDEVAAWIVSLAPSDEEFVGRMQVAAERLRTKAYANGVRKMVPDYDEAGYFAPKVAHVVPDAELMALADKAEALMSINTNPIRWTMPTTGIGSTPTEQLVAAYHKLVPDELWESADLVSSHLRAIGQPLPGEFTQAQWNVLRAARNNLKHAIGTAEETATLRALENVVPFLDSHEQRSMFAEYGRNFLPFWYAEENFLRRWGRTLSLSPLLGLDSLRKAQLTYMGIKSAGVIRTDANGKDWFVYPGSGLLSEALSKILPGDALPVGVLFQASTDSLLPGINPELGAASFSPFVATPMDLVLQLFPDTTDLRRALIGEIGMSKHPLEHFVPATLSNTWRALFAGEDSSARYASAMNSAIAYMEANDQALPEGATPEQVDEYLDKVRNHARIIMVAQAITGFVVPGAPVSVVSGESVGSFDWLTGMNIESPDEIVSDLYRSYVYELGIEEGTQAFLAAFPYADLEDITNPLALTVPMATSVSGAPLPATRTGLAWYLDNQQWIDQQPEAGAWFLPHDDEADFDYYSYSQQLVNGLRKRRSPTDFLRAIKYRQGADVYFTARDTYEQTAAGLGNDSNAKRELDARWETWKSTFLAVHPIFAEELVSGEGRERRARTISQIRYAVTDPSAPPSPHMDAIGQLSRAFDKYQGELKLLQQRNDANTQERKRQLKAGFEQWVAQWQLRNPRLERLWSSVYRPEAGL